MVPERWESPDEIPNCDMPPENFRAEAAVQPPAAALRQAAFRLGISMLRVLLLLPFLVLLVVFALSNPQPVPLGLWPTDYSLEVPVSIAILTASGVFFFLGALFVWFGSVAARTRHRRAEKRAAGLEAALRAHTAPPPISARTSTTRQAGGRSVAVLAAPK